MGKDSFILYDNYDEQLAALTDLQIATLFRAIYDYRHNRKLPEMDGAVKMAFSFIRAQIDRDQERYDDICEKRRAAGALGGAPKGNQNAGKQAKQANATKCKQNNQMQAKQPDNDNVNDNENDNEYDIGDLSPKPPQAKRRFVAPTIDEVQAYCEERGNGINAAYFVDYYTAIGWKISGKAAMKDWKATVRTWEKNEQKRAATQEPPHPITERRYFEWDGD